MPLFYLIMNMKRKIQIPSLSNYAGVVLVLILSWWIKIELDQEQSEVLYLSLWIGIFIWSSIAKK